MAAPHTVPLPPKIATPPMTAAPTRVELEAEPGLRVDRAVAGGVEHAGEARRARPRPRRRRAPAG